ncbi:MAG: hypothetical protein LIQ30_09610 [Planctomycetes bacterium]|nr:hypothetical protein [Planctomycetota bacterium]
MANRRRKKVKNNSQASFPAAENIIVTRRKKKVKNRKRLKKRNQKPNSIRWRTTPIEVFPEQWIAGKKGDGRRARYSGKITGSA